MTAITTLGQTEMAERIRLCVQTQISGSTDSWKTSVTQKDLTVSDQEEVGGRKPKTWQQKLSETIIHSPQLADVSQLPQDVQVLSVSCPLMRASFFLFSGCYRSVVIWSHCWYFLCPLLEATSWIPHLVFSVSPSLWAEAGKTQSRDFA